MQYEIIILSLGGSLIVPNGGIATDFLKQLHRFITDQLNTTNRRFFIITGGGATARHYQKGAQGVLGDITSDDTDWLGIHATRLNAHLIRTIFRDVAHPVVVESYDKQYDIQAHERVVVGAGWRPGCSTDYDATMVAKRFGATCLINMSNIDMVYDKDPQKHADARPIKRWSWDEYRHIAGDTWIPGMNVPFDPIATKLAAQLGLAVIILNGTKLDNLKAALDGADFVGTTIS